MNRKRRRSFFRDAVTADWLRRGMRVPFILSLPPALKGTGRPASSAAPIERGDGQRLGAVMVVQDTAAHSIFTVFAVQQIVFLKQVFT